MEIDRLKIQLSQEFETKDLGSAKKILGMEIRIVRTLAAEMWHLLDNMKPIPQNDKQYLG